MATSKQDSTEEKIKLPATETISRFYQPQRNRKAIRILTVAVYVLCVSLAAIMLSLYYIFIWDPTIKPFMPKATNCDKSSIPEHIAIRLANSTEITAEEFYRKIQNYYQSIHKTNENAININNQINKDNTINQKSTSHSIYNYRKRPKHPKSMTMATPPPLTTPTTRLIPILKTYRRKHRLRIDEDDEGDDEDDKSADGSGQFINPESLETKLTFS